MLGFLFFIDVDVFIFDQFDEERINILVCFIGMDILWVIHRSYPWIVMAAYEVLKEETAVIPPE